MKKIMVVLLIIVMVRLFFGSVAAAQEAKPIKIGVSFGQNVQYYFAACAFYLFCVTVLPYRELS